VQTGGPLGIPDCTSVSLLDANAVSVQLQKESNRAMVLTSAPHLSGRLAFRRPHVTALRNRLVLSRRRGFGIWRRLSKPTPREKIASCTQLPAVVAQ